MKKFILACLLALPLTAASRQEASAWCDFKIGAGFAFACHCNGFCACPPCGPNCVNPWAGAPVAPLPGYGPAAPKGQTPTAPTALPIQYQAGYVPNAGFAPAGYFQDPAYMYGR